MSVQVINKKQELQKRIARFRQSFPSYSSANLKILAKPMDGDPTGHRRLAPFVLNSAQLILHRAIEKMIDEVGYARIIVLKGRQQGISTYTEARFFWKTTLNAGIKTYILTHKGEATDNLFAMVDRFKDNCSPLLLPRIGRSNAKEIYFNRLDSQYQVSTAGSKGAGRSATLTHVHGSEVAFWENGEDHLAGMLQAVPLAPGTEVILESTALGMTNVFYSQWSLAERGLSDFRAVFIPWFIQEEYRRPAPDDYEVTDSREDVPEGEMSHAEYQEAFGCDRNQMYWRHKKIAEMGGGEKGFSKFKQEYPATPDEAFQSSSGASLLSRAQVVKARKSNVSTEGKLIIGVDPAGGDPEGDATAIIRRRTRKAFGLQRFQDLNTMQLVAVIMRIIKNENPWRIYLDVGGLGKGVFDRLMEFPAARGIVIAVNFGEQALEPEEYVNRRVEMYYGLDEWLSDPGGANIPDDDQLQGCLLSVKRDHDDSNQRKRLKSKKWMRSEGFPSPDEADALALTFAEPFDVYYDSSGDGSGQFEVEIDPLGGAIDDVIMDDNFSGFDSF